MHHHLVPTPPTTLPPFSPPPAPANPLAFHRQGHLPHPHAPSKQAVGVSPPGEYTLQPLPMLVPSKLEAPPRPLCVPGGRTLTAPGTRLFKSCAGLNKLLCAGHRRGPPKSTQKRVLGALDAGVARRHRVVDCTENFAPVGGIGRSENGVMALHQLDTEFTVPRQRGRRGEMGELEEVRGDEGDEGVGDEEEGANSRKSRCAGSMHFAWSSPTLESASTAKSRQVRFHASVAPLFHQDN